MSVAIVLLRITLLATTGGTAAGRRTRARCASTGRRRPTTTPHRRQLCEQRRLLPLLHHMLLHRRVLRTGGYRSRRDMLRDGLYCLHDRLPLLGRCAGRTESGQGLRENVDRRPYHCVRTCLSSTVGGRHSDRGGTEWWL